MKKMKIQNIILYFINFILIGFIIFSNKGIILNNNRITLKNMNESTQVNDLNKTIEALNNSHTEYSKDVEVGKGKIANAINVYQNNNATAQNSLEEFSTMINNLTNIPENTYYYEEGTEGDSSTIVRYKKVDSSYYVCNANGIVLEGTSAADVSSKTLIPYKASIAENISAGYMGYVSGLLYLGDGSDNASYVELAKSNYRVKVSWSASYSGPEGKQTKTGVYQFDIVEGVITNQTGSGSVSFSIGCGEGGWASSSWKVTGVTIENI